MTRFSKTNQPKTRKPGKANREAVGAAVAKAVQGFASTDRVKPRAKSAKAPAAIVAPPAIIAGPGSGRALAPTVQTRRNGGRLFGLEDATHADVLGKAGLDWTVEKVPLVADGQAMPSHVAIRRSDTREMLGVVGADYAPLQNAEMVEFFRTVGEYMDVSYETGGCFQGGKVVFLTAAMKADDLIIGDDVVKPFFLISNGHVGNRKLTLGPTTIRPICWNTLAMANRQIRGAITAGGESVGNGYQIRHFAGIKKAMEDVRDAYIRASRAWAQTGDALKLLAATPLTAHAFEQMMREPFKVDLSKDETKVATAFREQREARLHAILASDTCQVKGTAGTLFAGLQAITEYADHEWPIRAGDNKEERRAHNALITGEIADAKARAFGLALELAGA